jgi:hypothetical protein
MSFNKDVSTGQLSKPTLSYASVIANSSQTPIIVPRPSKGRLIQSNGVKQNSDNKKNFSVLVERQRELLKLSTMSFIEGKVKSINNDSFGQKFQISVDGKDRSVLLSSKFFNFTLDEVKEMIGKTFIWSSQSENLLEKSQLWYPTDRQMEIYRENHANSNGYFNVVSLFTNTGTVAIKLPSGKMRWLSLEVFMAHGLAMLRSINSKGFNFKKFIVELRDGKINGIFIPIDVFPNRGKMMYDFLNEDNLFFQMFGKNNIREIPEILYSTIDSALNRCSHPDYKQIKIEEEKGVFYVELISIIKHFCDRFGVPSEKHFYQANDTLDLEREIQKKKAAGKSAKTSPGKSVTDTTKELSPVQKTSPGKSVTDTTKELSPVQKTSPGKSVSKSVDIPEESVIKDSWSDSSDDEEEKEETVESLKNELARLRKLIGKTTDIPGKVE